MRKIDIEEYNISIEEFSNLVDNWIFSERDRNILKRKIIDGITFEKTAEEFGMSVQGVKRIVYKGLEKVFKHI